MDFFTLDTQDSIEEFNQCVQENSIIVKDFIDITTIKIYYNNKESIVNFNISDINKINFNNDSLYKIMYGRTPLSNIVNISYKDNNQHIFTEKSGIVKEYVIPYKHYALSNISNNQTKKLLGKNHFNYIREYDTIDEFLENKRNIYKFGLYTLNNYPEAFMIKSGFTYYKGMKPSDPSILSFDIETSGLNPHSKDATVFLITNTFRKNGNIINKTFNLKDYYINDKYNDSLMISDWCDWIRTVDPSIVIGHNITIFDLEYLNVRSGYSLKLGRDGSDMTSEERPREFRKDGSQSYSYHRKQIFGREIVDTFFLAIRYDVARKYPSYGLKPIIAYEGLEDKNRVFIDASKISTYFHSKNSNDWSMVVKYGEADSGDSLKLYDLMGSSIFYMTQMIPKQLQVMTESATGSQLNSLLVRSYLQDGYAVAKANDSVPFEGAISIGNTGIYRNVVKYDVASLYPSIMVEYNIQNSKKDFNHNFQKIVKYLRTERLANKKKAKETGERYYNDLQEAQKIAINSLYGFLGASGLNYNYPEGAAEVTRKGREILTKAIDWSTKEHSFLLVNADTDSISICKKDFSPISPEENLMLLNELNSLFSSNISWEDDGSYPYFAVLKAKNYILYDGKKVKLKGSSLKDSKKEPILKKMLNDMINDLVHNEGKEILNLYHSYIKLALNPTDIKEWCQKKTITKSILDCDANKEARKNERDVFDAIKGIQVQEGDKCYVYPAILSSNIEETQLKNGKVKIKETQQLGLKISDNWKNDHNPEKLVDRVYSTAVILSGVLGEDFFIDYTLKKNKDLLNDLKTN